MNQNLPAATTNELNINREGLKNKNLILHETDDLLFEVLTSKDSEEAKRIVALSFMDEPFTKLISTHIREVKLTDFYDLMKLYLEEVCSNNLSVLARDKSTSKIIGVCFNMDYTYLDDKFEESNLEGINNENVFEPVFVFIGSAGDTVKKSYPSLALKNSAIDIWQLALLPEWRGKKIANELVRFSIQLIKDSGFQYAVCEATSFFTRKIMEKNEFKCVYKQDVRGWEYNGRCVFEKQQPPHQEFTMWLKKFSI